MTQKEHDEKIDKLRISLVEAEKQIQDIRNELEELNNIKIEPESRRWKPERGQIYYYIASSGDIFHETWNEGYDDLLRFAIGNVFKTEKEAEFEFERLKVIAELREFAEPENRVWNGLDYHCSIFYNYNRGGLDIQLWSIMRTDSIYFESKDKAREAIKAVGEDKIKKYYLRVEG